MAKYKICKKCKKLIEFNPEIRHEGGTTYSIAICPLCGNVETNTINHIHYGNDGKK